MISKLKNAISSRGLSYSAVFVAGIIAGTLITFFFTVQPHGSGHEIREGRYRYINPLLECEGADETIGDPELKPFKHQVEALINKAKKRKGIDEVGVYFRDLNNGPAFGINALEKFAPASLMKVPLMMAFYKFAETDPGLLKQQSQMTDAADANESENIKPSRSIRPQTSYAIDELIRYMIVYSDNNAHNVIAKKLSPKFLAKTYEDLGLLPPDSDLADFMSVKSYSSCFRILFNASYLGREMSEKALETLAQPEYRKGLVAGVPEGTVVAHKFGERAFLDNDKKQLHDCGIVYYPDNPYLLCIMTRGADFDRLEETIRDISKLVYEEVGLQQNRHEYRAVSSR